ncbi:hypothetical protein QTP70_032609 [Hemibagrus guttatus]|uniref:Reverse transcriptase/retrotransposon-derived protein RNase H-like domain-containing protein n=1 Tax=Hemibagrus guttatus TaxID=175788 RepID=A0AAE0Q0A2_9TELE|nr:hypothetical protein QTP70_032609 [Hemibagrus guttatus]
MPYGLANAPSVFQDFIHELGRTSPHVAEVLGRLRNFSSSLKQRNVPFTSPQCSSSGITSAVVASRWTRGRSPPSGTSRHRYGEGTSMVPQIRNFYRRFISNYSSIADPLTNLLRNKPKSLLWSPATEGAFNTLKRAFTTAPLLIHPDPDKPFVVEVDASTTGVVLLSQQQGNPSRLHPCAFFSHKLNPAERNYDISNGSYWQSN